MADDIKWGFGVIVAIIISAFFYLILKIIGSI